MIREYYIYMRGHGTNRDLTQNPNSFLYLHCDLNNYRRSEGGASVEHMAAGGSGTGIGPLAEAHSWPLSGPDHARELHTDLELASPVASPFYRRRSMQIISIIFI
jgi:hypothetical protein